jgi:hypothetical protein
MLCTDDAPAKSAADIADTYQLYQGSNVFEIMTACNQLPYFGMFTDPSKDVAAKAL